MSLLRLGRWQSQTLFRRLDRPTPRAPNAASIGLWGGSPAATQGRKPFSSSLAGTVLVVLVGFGLSKVYQKYRRKQKLLQECERLPESVYFKAKLPLVRYRGCVLPEDVVASGTLSDIHDLEMRPDDVIVASFPKSGTTWLQETVYLLCHLSAEEPEKLKDAVMETKFPYLEYPYPGLNDIRGRSHRRFIKTHLPCHLLPTAVADKGCKVLYIYRNPKDVAVSYFHFARSLVYIQFCGTIHKFCRLLMKDAVPYAPFFAHLGDYKKMTLEKPEQFFTIAYEDMMEDPKKAVKRIAEFLAVEATDEQVDDICRQTSFEAMKANPRTNYEHWKTFGLKVKGGSDFFRKGVVGDYKNHLTDEFIAEEFAEWVARGVESTKIAFKYQLKREEQEQ